MVLMSLQRKHSYLPWLNRTNRVYLKKLFIPIDKLTIQTFFTTFNSFFVRNLKCAFVHKRMVIAIDDRAQMFWISKQITYKRTQRQSKWCGYARLNQRLMHTRAKNRTYTPNGHNIQAPQTPVNRIQQTATTQRHSDWLNSKQLKWRITTAYSQCVTNGIFGEKNK